MKQFRLFLTILTLLVVGSMNTWAETATLSISEGVTANGNLTDDKSNVWALLSDGAYISNNSYIQVGSGSKAVTYLKLTSSAFSSQNISKIQVWGTSKANTGVTVKISIGNKLLGTSTAYTTQNASSGGSEFSVENTNNYTGDITIEISRSSSAKGAIYFNKAIVTYTTATSCTKPTFTIENKTISLSEASTGDYDMSTNLTINKGGSTGAITYSCENNDVDVTDGKFKVSNAGTYTINATMAADATYCESPTSFTITVQSAPCISLDVPSNLSVGAITATTAELSWNAVPNASKYHIIVAGSKETYEFDTENGSVTSISATGLDAKENYLWTVTALRDGNGYCDSEESEMGDFVTEDYKIFTISWTTQDGTTQTVVKETQPLVLPSTAPVSCDPNYADFVGWYTIQHGTPAKPTSELLGTKATESLVPTENMQFYAVFGASNSGTTTFTKITSEPVDWTGEYILVYEKNETEAYVWTGVDAARCYVTETIDNDKIVSGASLVTLNITSEGYIQIQGGSNNEKYIGRNSSSNGLDFNITGLKNTFSYNASQTCVNIISNGGAAMRFNLASDQLRFRYYKNASGQEPVLLYKKTSVMGSSSGYISVCKNQLVVSGNVMLTSGYTTDGGIRVTTPIAISTSYLDADATTIRVTYLDETMNATGNSCFALYNADGTMVGSQNISAADHNYFVGYTPANYAASDKGTIRFELLNDADDVLATADMLVQGRSLPEQFVIAAETADGWVALPADLSLSANDPVKTVYHINVDNVNRPTKALQAPYTAVYTSAKRAEENVCSDGIRFRTADNTYLQGSTSAAVTRVWLSASSDPKTQVWVLSTNDFNDYLVRMDASADGRYLSYYKKEKRIANYKQEQVLRFLPVENLCTRFDAPELKEEQVQSTTATLTWKLIAGVVAYEYSIDGQTSWTECTDVKISDGKVFWTLSGLVPTTRYTISVRAKVETGDNCSEIGSLAFKTTDCDDVPYDLAYTADLSSVTITWKCNAASAKVVLYSDPECADDDIVDTQTANAKTCTFKGLPENIVRYAKVFAGGLCASEVLEVKTESPQMDVVEWDVDKINVSINTEEKVSVVLENEVTKQTGQDASDIFFSKYFEAAGSVKLLAIYNGTKRTIDLSNVRIEGMAVTTTEQVWNADPYDIIDLSPIGSIAPDQEIVLYSLFTHHTVDYDNAKDADGESTYNDKKRSIEIAKCIQDKQGWAQEGWYPVGDNTIRVLQDVGYADAVNKFGNSEIATGGDKVYRLIRTDNNVNTDIDIIGAADTDADGNRTIVKTSDMSKPTNGDKEGWTCNEGAEYEGDPNVSYQLSTNRHLLIRKNSVVSGANAVALNTDGFHTLCTEWEGRIVPKNGAAGETENDITCSEFDNVLGFNYNEYYTEYETFMEQKEFEESSRNSDGTITIDMPADNTLDKIPCQKLKIIVKNSNNEEIIANEYKVPIIVNQNINTENPAFFGDKLTNEICKTCDVVVRDKAKLTHTATGVSEFRDMYVYAGSKLEIPEGTAMMLGSVYMFATNDSVSYAIVNNTDGATTPAITIGNVVHIKRIDGRYWYPFSLPYDCNIADIVQLNGQPLGVYGTDWGIKYYDGRSRQRDGNSTTHYGEVSKYWTKMPEDGQLKAYTGYIIGLFVPAADEPLMKSVNFPPATESAYTENASSKTTPITNWSVNLNAEPRHRGWNFVGSPYISLFGSNNLGEGEGLYNTNVQMGWTDALGKQQDKDNIYVSIPNGGNTNTYTQALASGVTIRPFSAYFVQAIDPTDGQSNTRNLMYSKGHRSLPTSAPARTAKTDALILTELDITNGALGDNTGVLVSNVYSAEYEIGDDLTKMYAAAQKPQLYTIDAHNDKMAYQALPDVLAHAIPLGIYVPQAGNYTLSLNRYVSRLEAAEAVYLLHNGAVVANLLLSDYTVAASAKGTISGYSLDIRRAPEVVTDIVPAAGDAPYIIARDGVLAIANLPADAVVQVYDVLGHRLLQTDTHAAGILQVPVPQTGVYTVVITTADGQQVLKTLLR